MLRPFLNWRTLLALIAILIVSGTIWYSSYLAEKIKKDEQHKVEVAKAKTFDEVDRRIPRQPGVATLCKEKENLS